MQSLWLNTTWHINIFNCLLLLVEAPEKAHSYAEQYTLGCYRSNFFSQSILTYSKEHINIHHLLLLYLFKDCSKQNLWSEFVKRWLKSAKTTALSCIEACLSSWSLCVGCKHTSPLYTARQIFPQNVIFAKIWLRILGRFVQG